MGSGSSKKMKEGSAEAYRNKSFHDRGVVRRTSHTPAITVRVLDDERPGTRHSPEFRQNSRIPRLQQRDSTAFPRRMSLDNYDLNASSLSAASSRLSVAMDGRQFERGMPPSKSRPQQIWDALSDDSSPERGGRRDNRKGRGGGRDRSASTGSQDSPRRGGRNRDRDKRRGTEQSSNKRAPSNSRRQKDLNRRRHSFDDRQQRNRRSPSSSKDKDRDRDRRQRDRGRGGGGGGRDRRKR